ncbi:MAG: hypothetical protein LBM95_02615 [Lactobacillales bacterium]|jgi:IS30 family transposase|nr:hypothetical protein [Lactobacillales bacterium]
MSSPLTERKTRFEVIVKIDGKSTNPVTKALQDIKSNAGEHFPKIFKTITSDNGSEFSDLSQTLKNVVDVYFSRTHTLHGNEERES